MEVRKDIFGWFEKAEDTVPTHDPGLDGLCPICSLKLSLPVKTISLMKVDDNKSYFYRTHKNCYDNIAPDDLSEIEGSLIDNL